MTPKSASAYAMLTAMARLNALPRRKQAVAVPPMLLEHGRMLNSNDLLNRDEALARSGKAALATWDADAVFIEVATLVALYRACTRKGRMALLEDEMFGGWFAEQGNDDCDADGEFCSTPSHNVDDAPVSIAEFEEDLDYCSANGVLFVY